MSSDPDPERQRSLNRETSSDASPLFILPPPNPLTAADQQRRERLLPRAPRGGMSHSYRGRPSQFGSSDRYMSRSRARMGGTSGGSASSLSHLQNAQILESELEAASSSLRAILDDPIPNFSSPPIAAQSYAEEAAMYNRQAKRRKLDSERPGFSGFSYGKYGQNEPGQLKMEIVSCDGGIFEEHHGNYAAENLLENDATVYCTKSNRCNLVLRHQGGTIFCLKELVIKAPHSGYTAP